MISAISRRLSMCSEVVPLVSVFDLTFTYWIASRKKSNCSECPYYSAPLTLCASNYKDFISKLQTKWY